MSSPSRFDLSAPNRRAGGTAPATSEPGARERVVESATALLPLAVQLVLLGVVAWLVLRGPPDDGLRRSVVEALEQAKKDQASAVAEALEQAKKDQASAVADSLEAALVKHHAEQGKKSVVPVLPEGPNRPSVPTPESLQQQVKDAQQLLKDFQEEVTKFKTDRAAHEDQLARKVADETSRYVESVVTRHVDRPLQNLSESVLGLKGAVAGISAQYQRQGARTDVALVVYHAKDIDANQLLPAVEEVVLDQSRPNYPDCHLGVYVVSGKKVVATVVPLVNRGPKAPGPTEGAFNGIGLRVDTDSGEDVRELPVADLVPEAAPGTRIRRRCVFLVSTRSTPPGADDARWSKVGADAIVVAKAPPGNAPRPAEEEAQALKTLDDWDQFCRAHDGGAVRFRFSTRPDAAQVKALAQRLRWLISPF